jgi:CubicO group peptidase (beta-lactamase class C family)
MQKKIELLVLQLAVIKDNVIVKTSHYGLASVEDSIAVDVKLFFNSITKAFTGVAIMQLVENGKLS